MYKEQDGMTYGIRDWDGGFPPVVAQKIIK